MADKTRADRRHFTYVQWAEFFDPPSPPSKNKVPIKDATRKIAQRKPRNRKIKRGPHSRTKDVLQNLREIRRDAIKHGFPIPKREIAMKDAGGISPNTWKQNDRELWSHWDESRYKM